ncbi:LLM class flavin-dependent oxidoreductase [Nocardia nova]|nr:LLM class flavin-dependent oxidoreductase [Nocardia nova]
MAAARVLRDKASGVFADPDKVHVVDHAGTWFKTRGPLTVPHSPQSRPVIIQAGSSPVGKDFAARWAEAVFEIDPTPEGRRAYYYDDLKSRASDFGRNPDDLKIFPSFVPFVGSAAQAPGTFNDFVDLVVPELQRRGLFRTDYTGTTLRDHLGLGPASLKPAARGGVVRTRA